MVLSNRNSSATCVEPPKRPGWEAKEIEKEEQEAAREAITRQVAATYCQRSTRDKVNPPARCSRCNCIPFGQNFERTSASKWSYGVRPLSKNCADSGKSRGGLKSPTPEADSQTDGGTTRPPKKHGAIDGTSRGDPSAAIAVKWATCRGFVPVGPHGRGIFVRSRHCRASDWARLHQHSPTRTSCGGPLPRGPSIDSGQVGAMRSGYGIPGNSVQPFSRSSSGILEANSSTTQRTSNG